MGIWKETSVRARAKSYIDTWTWVGSLMSRFIDSQCNIVQFHWSSTIKFWAIVKVDTYIDIAHQTASAIEYHHINVFQGSMRYTIYDVWNLKIMRLISKINSQSKPIVFYFYLFFHCKIDREDFSHHHNEIFLNTFESVIRPPSDIRVDYWFNLECEKESRMTMEIFFESFWIVETKLQEFSCGARDKTWVIKYAAGIWISVFVHLAALHPIIQIPRPCLLYVPPTLSLNKKIKKYPQLFFCLHLTRSASRSIDSTPLKFLSKRHKVNLFLLQRS